MDGNTTLIIVVIFAILVVVFALLYRRRLRATIKMGPVQFDVDGESSTSPAMDAPDSDSDNVASGGIRIEDAETGGGILAEDNTGVGVNLKKVKAEDDIIATTNKPDDAPKA